MCNTMLLLQMVSLGLVFVMFVTGAFKKSISNTMFVIATAVAMQDVVTIAYSIQYIIGHTFLVVFALLSLARTMFHHINDTLVRG